MPLRYNGYECVQGMFTIITFIMKREMDMSSASRSGNINHNERKLIDVKNLDNIPGFVCINYTF